MADTLNPSANVSATAPTVQPTPAPMGSLTPPANNGAPLPAGNNYSVGATPPVSPDTAYHAGLGKLAATLLGNQTSYAVDPQTGQTVATQTPQKPGQLFKNIVAGALLGGAASAAAPRNGGGFLGGFATGGNAVQQDARKQDLQKRAQAQQEFSNTQERQKFGLEQERQKLESQRFDQEKIFQQAQIHQWTATELQHDRDMDMQSQEFLQRQNQFNTDTQLHVQELGGVESPIMVGGKNINGQPDNGADLQKYMSDPKNLQAPSGYVRMPISTVDMTGIHQDPKTNTWLDEKGNKVSLNDRTTWHVYDIPQNTLSKPQQVTGAEMNRLAGTNYPADAKLTVPGDKYISLATQAKQRDIEQERVDRQDRATVLQGQNDLARMEYTDAQRELSTAEAAGDPAAVQAAKDKMASNEQTFKTSLDQISTLYGGKPVKVAPLPKPNGNTPPPIPLGAPGSAYYLNSVDSGPLTKGHYVDSGSAMKVANEISALQTPQARKDYINKLTIKDFPSMKDHPEDFPSFKNDLLKSSLQATKGPNPNAEKVYTIVGPDGQTAPVPESKLQKALDLGGVIVQ